MFQYEVFDGKRKDNSTNGAERPAKEIKKGVKKASAIATNR